MYYNNRCNPLMTSMQSQVCINNGNANNSANMPLQQQNILQKFDQKPYNHNKITIAPNVNSKIFIQIASYRDTELKRTIQNILDNAQYPLNCTFGICWQHGNDENIDEYKSDARFKILDVYYTNSKGACWARSEVQKLYNGEQYTMQIDSHHRFIKNWDTTLISMLEGLRTRSKKPLLTAYVGNYQVGPPDKFLLSEPCFMQIDADGIRKDGFVGFVPQIIPNHRTLIQPIPARFFSGHFMFADGIICVECPYDPNIYFHGEEISYAIRAYTHGYDLYHPHIHILWHEYTRQYRKKHWDDHNVNGKDKIAWYERDRLSKIRIRKLFGLELPGDPPVDLTGYGFGNSRSFVDYQRYANMNFANKTVGTFNYF